MKICPYCGNQNKDQAKYCGYCGALLVPQKSAKKERKKTIAIASIITIFLLFVLVFVFTKVNSKNIMPENTATTPITTNGNDTEIINEASSPEANEETANTEVEEEATNTEEEEDATNTEAKEEEAGTEIEKESIPEKVYYTIETLTKKDKNGAVILKNIRDYDDQYREIYGESLNADNSLRRYWHIKYDKDGDYVDKTYYPDGSLYSTASSVFDLNQNTRTYICKDPSKNINYIKVHHFDDKHKEIGLVKLIPENEYYDNIEYYEYYSYKKDKLIKKTKCLEDPCKYDENSEIIGKHKVSKYSIVSWIEYKYNKKGEKIKAIEYNKDGSVKYTYSYKYEYLTDEEYYDLREN